MEDFDAIKAVKHEYLTRIQQDGRAEILRLALRAMKQDGVEVLQWEQFTRDDGSFAIGITKGDHIAPNVLVFGRMLDEHEAGRLAQVREARRPGSRYAKIEQCRRELELADKLFRRENIPVQNTTHTSIEEIASKILSQLGIERHMF